MRCPGGPPAAAYADGMPTPRTASLLAAAAALGLSAGTTPAAAQQQVSGGAALDANPQVGSGGVNRGAIQPDFRSRNLLITGQVTNGREFRGEVGYTAAGAFRGNLGSDDLFRFRAESFGSSPAALSLPTGPATSVEGGNLIFDNFYSPGVEAPAGAATRRVVSADGSQVQVLRPGGTFTSNFGTTPTLARSFGRDTDDPFDPADAASNLGRFQGEDGRVFELRGNSLSGTRRVDLTPARPGLNPDGTFRNTTPDPTVTADPLNPTAGNGPRTGQIRTDTTTRGALAQGTLDPNDPDTLDADAPAGPRSTARRDGRRNAQPGTVNPAEALLAQNNDGLPAALQLGAALTPSLTTPIAGAPTEPTADDAGSAPTEADTANAQRQARLQRLREQILGLDRDDRGGGNAYTELLEQIRGGGGGDAGAGLLPDAPGVATPQWMQQLQQGGPDNSAIQRAEQARAAALRQILANPDADPNDPTAAVNDPEATTPGAGDPEVEQILSELSYDLPRLEALHQEREGRLAKKFNDAQAALAEGKFFEAESYYGQLVREAPQNPLARIGQIHAEMGAGMIRSAAFHLRTLFEDHPELIAARYGEQLLPPANRLEWLRGELQDKLDDPTVSGAQPGLMAAYLGWQIQSRPLVRFGLAKAEEAKPLDPLMPVLRRIWLSDTR